MSTPHRFNVQNISPEKNKQKPKIVINKSEKKF